MIIRAILLFLLGTSLAFAQKGIPAKVVFAVRNDEGQPVTNATVEGCFTDLSPSGGRDRFAGRTDTNGLYRAEGVAFPGVYARFTCADYYSTVTERNRDLIRRPDGRGYEIPARWDVEIPVLLKRIRKPIPMYTREVENPYIAAFEAVGKYRLAATSRYDIAQGEFLPPHGRGTVADLTYTWKMAIYKTNRIGRALDRDMLCEIRMTNGLDGICRGIPDGGKGQNRNEGSACISAYEAPADGYTNVIAFHRNVRGTKAESNDDQHYLYYFRIRTQTNEMGQVTNALYGKIYGQINGNFTYYLNPTPNDRNMEFDPEKNLFKNLFSLEEVREP